MLDDLKSRCYDANLLLPQYGLVDLTFGNVSTIDRDRGIVAIKPSGVTYADLTPGDIVLVDLDGARVEGDLKPSSDTPTHISLYQAFETIGSVVHTHSRFATSFAQAGKPIECFGTTHADYYRGPVPVTRAMTPKEINGEYELETGQVIVECFAELDPMEYPGVLVRGHGPFSWGASSDLAVENAFALEVIAQVAYQSLQLNPTLEPLDPQLHAKHFLRKHGKQAYYGQK